MGGAGPGTSLNPRLQTRRRPGSSRSEARLLWLRQVSFRSRVSVLVAAAVGVAVAIAALSTYVAVSRQLGQEVNANLQSAVQEVPNNVHLVGRHYSRPLGRSGTWLSSPATGSR